MSEKEKKILSTISEVLPSLDEHEQERLLAYSEGMAFVKNCPSGKHDKTMN